MSNTQPDNSPLEVSAPTQANSPNTDDMAPGETDRVAATIKPAGHVEHTQDPGAAPLTHSVTGGNSVGYK